MALSINEEGEEIPEEDLEKNNKVLEENEENLRNTVHKQQSSRPYRLRRQVINFIV